MKPNEFLELIGVEDRGNLSHYMGKVASDRSKSLYFMGVNSVGRTWGMVITALYLHMLYDDPNAHRIVLCCSKKREWHFYGKISVGRLIEGSLLENVFEITMDGLVLKENGTSVLIVNPLDDPKTDVDPNVDYTVIMDQPELKVRELAESISGATLLETHHCVAFKTLKIFIE